jgi:hypothetical protein
MAVRAAVEAVSVLGVGVKSEGGEGEGAHCKLEK